MKNSEEVKIPFVETSRETGLTEDEQAVLREGGRDELREGGQDVRAPGSAGVPPARIDSRGWHSRGYLPHFDSSEVVQSITFRLVDSLPVSVVQRWQKELARLSEKQRDTEIRARVENYLDAGYGERLMRDPEVAIIVESALLYFDAQRYRLFAWSIMPNHVHVLVQFLPGHSMSSVLHSWKSFTSKQINLLLGRTGTIWQADYFDRYIRNETHFQQAKIYIEDNPCKAGLCSVASDWRWSSARRR